MSFTPFLEQGFVIPEKLFVRFKLLRGRNDGRRRNFRIGQGRLPRDAPHVHAPPVPKSSDHPPLTGILAPGLVQHLVAFWSNQNVALGVKRPGSRPVVKRSHRPDIRPLEALHGTPAKV